MTTFRARLRRRVGLRGTALLGLGILDLVYAYGLVYPPRPVGPQYLLASRVASLWLWAVLWTLVGLWLVVFAFKRNDTAGFTAAIMLKVGWGIMLGVGWVAGDGADRAYVSSAIWLAFACCVFVIMAGVDPPAPHPDDS